MAVQESGAVPTTPGDRGVLQGDDVLRGDVEEHAVAAFFAEVSRDLLDQHDAVPTLQKVAQHALTVVPAGDHCGISLVRGQHHVETGASTSPLALICDTLQYDLDEGPCLEAVWTEDIYLVEDTRSEIRWPRWGAGVAEAGIRSVLSIRLATSRQRFGALNLYAENPHAFTKDDLDIATIYALHAGSALSAALMVDGLQQALRSRHTIGVAQGILMQSYGIGVEQAFEVLRRYSSHTNTKLRVVAESVVASGDLPGGRPDEL